MKNYIANSKGDWATSAAFVKYSFERSIHHGRSYTSGGGFLSKGNDEDLAEALRCLGQGLHTLEDFGAHTNYVELALIEMGHRNIFPLVGTQTGINLRGKHVFPLVTGTFGTVDFYHSVLGEATDHFTQSEVNEMDNAMGIAQQSASSSNPLTTLIKLLSKMPGTRDLCEEAERLQAASANQARAMSSRGFDGSTSRGMDDGQYQASRAGPGDYSHQDNYPSQQNYSNYSHQQGYNQPQQYHDPNAGGWNQPQQQYHELPSNSYQQQQYNQPQQNQWHDSNNQGFNTQSHDQYNQPHWQQQQQQSSSVPQQSTSNTAVKPTDGSQQAPPQGLPGMPDFDPAKTIKQIYPILAFRDKVVRTISGIIEKIPGLEALVDRIVETLTVFVLSLLAPFVRPVLTGLTNALQTGSAGVIDSSGKHQYEVWTDPRSSDPTHSMLSKDHFSNILNPPAGMVAGEILRYIAPRVLYAWENPNVPIDRVMADIEGIFHHPAIRDERNECHRNMFKAVQQWKDSLSDRGRSLDDILSIQGVKEGKNHKGGVNEHIGHGSSMQTGGHGTSFGTTHQSGQQQGGIGGYMNQAQSFLGSMSGQSHGSSQQHNSQQGGYSSYLNQAQSLMGSFTGQGQSHSSSQQHSQGGGLGDMLSMASKLPIPGVSNFASSVNKYSSFIPGGGRRGIDEDTGSREISSTGYEGLQLPGASQIGGASELHDAARMAEGGRRSPSPMPLAPPSGYESYSSRGHEYDGSGYQESQYGNQYGQQGQYDSRSGGGSSGYYGGGESGSYYR